MNITLTGGLRYISGTLFFIDSKGNEMRDLRITGFEPPERFLERARQVR